jgi:signal transduction histidine kinase
LVEQVRDAGLFVSLTIESVPPELPARVDLFAYRIVQEALTNVLKHGGPGVHAQVRLGVEYDAIVVEVQDDGPGGNTEPGAGGTVPGSSGLGIVGMRERALLLGGSLDAGPRPAGGFRVMARLPIGGEPV